MQGTTGIVDDHTKLSDDFTEFVEKMVSRDGWKHSSWQSLILRIFLIFALYCSTGHDKQKGRCIFFFFDLSRSTLTDCFCGSMRTRFIFQITSERHQLNLEAPCWIHAATRIDNWIAH